jgi:hypothetical protein
MIMPKKPKFTVPYRKSDGYVPRTHYDVWDSIGYPDLWEHSEPRVFEETMKLEGRCGKLFVLRSSTGVPFEMFPTELLEMIQTTTLFHGVVSGRWTHVKRSSAFGLKYLGPIT